MRPPLIALAAIAALLSTCSPKPEMPAELASPETALELDFTTASQSFQEKIQSHLDLLKLSDKVSSAIVNPHPPAGMEEIVYIFHGFGSERLAQPAMRRLGNKWPAVRGETSWIPWDKIPNQSSTRPGIFMSAYAAEKFRLTLWIDYSASDLYICYSGPA
ncbi:MAG: hypothetical protein ACI8XO_003305 [Verrucomicrobiales bacterium]|jgi:hypothetical protein